MVENPRSIARFSRHRRRCRLVCLDRRSREVTPGERFARTASSRGETPWRLFVLQASRSRFHVRAQRRTVYATAAKLRACRQMEFDATSSSY